MLMKHKFHFNLGSLSLAHCYRWFFLLLSVARKLWCPQNLSQKICTSCHFQMVEVDIPQSLFEEQGRQLYGANLLEIQVLASCNIFRPIKLLGFQQFYIFMISIQKNSLSDTQFCTSSYLA